MSANVTLEFATGPSLEFVESTVTLQSVGGSSAADVSSAVSTHNANPPHPHTNAANVWTLGQSFTVGASVGVAGTPADLVLYATHATVPWKFHSYSAIFNGVRDDILSIGFNVWNQDDTTKAGIALQFENDYYADEGAGLVHVSEFILAWNAPTGGGPSGRPWQINCRYNDGIFTHLLRGGFSFYNSNPAASPSFELGEDGVFTAGSAGIVSAENNRQFLMQKNAAGTRKGLIYLDASSVTQIAPDGGGAAVNGAMTVKSGTLHLGRAGGFNNLQFDTGDSPGTYKWAFYLGGSGEMYLWNGSKYAMSFENGTTTAKIGFFSYSPTAEKQTVTGSRGSNAALASLLTALAAYGLITNSTTA